MLNKNSTDIRFDEKVTNNGGEGFILTTELYKRANHAALFSPKKKNTEGKAAVHLEGTTINKQGNKTTKKLATRKIHANDLHAKIRHPGEDRMRVAAKHLHYIIKGMIEVFEDYATAKIKQKSLHKVAEERDLKPGK